MGQFIRVARVTGIIAGGLLTLLAVVLAYLAVPAAARQSFDAIATSPVPLWVVLALAVVTLATLVVLFGADKPRESLSDEARDQLTAGLTHEIAHMLLAQPLAGDLDAPDSVTSQGREAYAQELPRLLDQLMEFSQPELHPEAIARWVETLGSLPDPALAFVDVIVNSRHLELHEYDRLLETPLRETVQLLRREGLLFPVTEALTDRIVYFLPSSECEAIREALSRFAHSSHVYDDVCRWLRVVGYTVPEE